MRTLLPLVLLAAATSACWSFDKYDNQASATSAGTSDAGSATGGTWKTMKLAMTAMAPHPGDLFEYRIVSASNVIVSRGFWDPLGGNDATVVALHAIPPTGGPYRVDFWADQNKNRTLDAAPVDHTWRRKLEAPDAVVGTDEVTVTFKHDFNFDDIQTDSSGNPKVPVEGPAPAVLTFTNAASLVGKLVNVRVLDDAGHQVGQYRYQSFPDPALTSGVVTTTIPGITEEGALDTVEIFADADGNRTYDPSSRGGGDKTWKLTATAGGDGLKLSFDPGSSSGAAEINDPNL